MRISKQPSGGRGEYEIAGELPADVTIDGLTGRALELILGGRRLKTAVVLRLQGGKHRLRILAGGEMHAHRQVAAFLLLPKPIREEAKTAAGDPIVRRNAYVLSQIETTNVELVGDDRFRAEVTSVTCENQDHQDSDALLINVPERFGKLNFIFENRDLFDPPLPSLLEQHRRQIEAGAPLQNEAERLVDELSARTALEADRVDVSYRDGDPVPALTEILEVEGVERTGTSLEELHRRDVSIRKRTVKKVRQAVSRGSEADKFRRDVNEAYDSRCVMCGLQLPSTQYSKAGVDAAHILPWREYDLDEVHNGVALCKLHHWAFEEGVLLLSWDAEMGTYRVDVPPEAEERLSGEEFSLEQLQDVVGEVPNERLPSDRSNWPHPDLLERLRDLVIAD